jgi:hypothetical protein
MTNEEIIKEEEEEATIQPLKVIAGGKKPPGFNWLSGLEVGTVFLTRPYHHSGKPFLDEYHVSYQEEHATQLYTNLNGEGYLWVDPIAFCGTMELIQIRLIYKGPNE